FFFSSRRRHTRSYGDWSSDVCSSDLEASQFERIADFAGRVVTHIHKADHLRLGHLREHTRVETAEVTGSDDADAGLHRMIPRCRSEERRVGKEWRGRGGGEYEEREIV